MIKVLKETPITAFGRDCMEQLVHDDTIWCADACDYCYYRDWNGWEDCGASCCEVHGCHINEPTYFKLIDLV